MDEESFGKSFGADGLDQTLPAGFRPPGPRFMEHFPFALFVILLFVLLFGFNGIQISDSLA